MTTQARVHILVLTNKNVASCRSLSNLPIFLCDDKAGGEPDYTLLAFLPFLNLITRQVPSGFVFSLKEVHSSEDFIGAMGMARNIQVDMVVWYSFVMPAASEGAIDQGVQEIVVKPGDQTEPNRYNYPSEYCSLAFGDRSVCHQDLRHQDLRRVYRIKPKPFG